jgi:hypothetical protein
MTSARKLEVRISAFRPEMLHGKFSPHHWTLVFAFTSTISRRGCVPIVREFVFHVRSMASTAAWQWKALADGNLTATISVDLHEGCTGTISVVEDSRNGRRAVFSIEHGNGKSEDFIVGCAVFGRELAAEIAYAESKDYPFARK